MIRATPGVLGVIMLLSVAACATETKYRERLSTWIGKPETELVSRWGPPDRVYENGKQRILTYGSRGSLVLPGTAPTYNVTRTGTSTYSATPSGGSPPIAVDLVCVTNFTVYEGVITDWNYRGNNCTSE